MTDDTFDNRIGRKLAPETLAAQALGHIDEVTRALVPPVHPSTTYERDPDGGYSSGRGYTRPHNPTYDEPEELLMTLEGGGDCLLFASGMAAATAVFQSLLPGDHVVASRVMYWALRTWLVDFAMSWGLEVEFVDTSDRDALAAAMRPGKTRLVWLDTPANPTWDVTDIAAAAEIARTGHARLAVDSTVATPVLTRPLELGADLVVHSASKYLNGHSDVLAGAVVCAEKDSFWQRIRAWRRDAGAVLGPFEAWLLLRGMRTLFVRVQRCSESALTIARHFEGHPRISKVLYPGLADHPGHAVAARQMTGGFGGMLSIRLKDGKAAAVATAARVEVFKRATSLGGVESLIEHRASIEGPSTPVPSDLLRLSIGLEDPQDLIADLAQALEHAVTAEPADGGATKSQDVVRQAKGEPEDEVAAKLNELLDERIRPLVADRGGDLVFQDLTDGIVELGITGSPGASVPIKNSIANMVRHYVPEVFDVRFVTTLTDADRAPRGSPDTSPSANLERVLDEQINPAVRAHGGFITLVEVKDGTAYIRFEGGCQGCAMADVTLRQGVEVMIKEQVPGIVTLVDVTDHASGTNPYFKTKKGPS
jgi:cystathionine gamma-synthase